MKNNSFSMMIFYFFTATFLVALTLAIYQFTNTSNIIDSSYIAQKKTDRNQVSVLKITDTYYVSGAQVLQSINLIEDIDCNIIVDGVVFPPNLDIKNTNVSVVNLKKNYVPSYIRDTSGSLKQVIFTSQ